MGTRRVIQRLTPVAALLFMGLAFGMGRLRVDGTLAAGRDSEYLSRMLVREAAEHQRVAALVTHLQSAHKTQNVIVVMIDGMRWQEVFRGADRELLDARGPDSMKAPQDRAAQAEALYWRDAPDERRLALMPFLWSVLAVQGQIFGNRELDSDSQVLNGLNFSYPGYSETLTGYPDPRVHSNANVPNPNQTVFEWLNRKSAFAGKIAAFGAWDAFNGIFNKQRCGFVVNAGYDPLEAIPDNQVLKLLNSDKAEAVRIWPDEPFDPLPFHTAVEYLKAAKPRVLFLGLGETDEWGHTGSYPEYLNAAHRADSYLRQIWDVVQSMPEYRGKTTLIVVPDHGRGTGTQWNDHGRNIPESRETWMAFLGPDTPPLGERRESIPVTESQVASTVAALLGENYRAAVPKAGEAIGDVLGK